MSGEFYGRETAWKGTARWGGQYSDGTSELTPSAQNEFYCIYCVTDTAIASYVGNITGLAGVTFAAGNCIFGRFSTITLTSGSVILYEDRDREIG